MLPRGTRGRGGGAEPGRRQSGCEDDAEPLSSPSGPPWVLHFPGEGLGLLGDQLKAVEPIRILELSLDQSRLPMGKS